RSPFLLLSFFVSSLLLFISLSSLSLSRVCPPGTRSVRSRRLKDDSMTSIFFPSLEMSCLLSFLQEDSQERKREKEGELSLVS
ncbi:hypothetical protein CSUI_003989, partial [Cystoisospora suis]